MKAEQKKRDLAPTQQYCKNCGNNKGMIHRYNINLCRRCFKEFAEMMGFKKYS
ncbi:MAG: 30S ribosomal protein S14 [Candidatus Iainarchaeum archaeon]|uniref:30S ribosomal protein S14 n=1 Tax=Candidatus Iainarchaeum sp. TaxID=3101447 RepID=A0A7T9I281_9ARCH|nr:MAG: 30S ribosomal protein S14 [Candidatus Diapherotrites archaeon]